MSESEQRKFLETINEALSGMSEFDKGYLLGMAEGKTTDKVAEIKEVTEPTGAAV